MTRGHISQPPRSRRPLVGAQVVRPSLRVAGQVEFLVDTSADFTLLAPGDALSLGLDVARLPQGTPSTGVGGRTPTASGGAQS